MKDKLEGLLDRIKELENELLVEVEAKQCQCSYSIDDRKVQHPHPRPCIQRRSADIAPPMPVECFTIASQQEKL